MSKERIVKNNSKSSELTNEQISNVSGGIVFDMRDYTNDPSKPYIVIHDKNLNTIIGKHKTKLGARLDALKHGTSPTVYAAEEVATNASKYNVMLHDLVKEHMK